MASAARRMASGGFCMAAIAPRMIGSRRDGGSRWMMFMAVCIDVGAGVPETFCNWEKIYLFKAIYRGRLPAQRSASTRHNTHSAMQHNSSIPYHTIPGIIPVD